MNKIDANNKPPSSEDVLLYPKEGTPFVGTYRVGKGKEPKVQERGYRSECCGKIRDDIEYWEALDESTVAKKEEE